MKSILYARLHPHSVRDGRHADRDHDDQADRDDRNLHPLTRGGQVAPGAGTFHLAARLWLHSSYTASHLHRLHHRIGLLRSGLVLMIIFTFSPLGPAEGLGWPGESTSFKLLTNSGANRILIALSVVEDVQFPKHPDSGSVIVRKCSSGEGWPPTSAITLCCSCPTSTIFAPFSTAMHCIQCCHGLYSVDFNSLQCNAIKWCIMIYNAL